MKVPVLFLIFNRPETEITVFNRIREYQPERLYVAADGPRADKEGEAARCEAARAIIDRVDWPCEIKTLFRERNLGCGLGVSSAVSWFCENEEYGCIVEDDVIPSVDFFAFCEEALPKYKDESKVMMISAFNPESTLKESSDCGFSHYANIWGWASWRRAWSHFDLEMKGPREAPLRKWIKFYGPLLGVYLRYCCRKLYSSFLSSGKWHAWGYQWTFTLFENDGLSLTPFVNLSQNVGVASGGGAHYETDASDPYEHLVTGRFSAPYNFPSEMKPTRQIERWTFKQVARVRVFGVINRLKKLL